MRAFSALCVHSKFEHHPHPLVYLCAKFHLFRNLHCWASPRRKIAYLAQPLSHSPSLSDATATKVLASELNTNPGCCDQTSPKSNDFIFLLSYMNIWSVVSQLLHRQSSARRRLKTIPCFAASQGTVCYGIVRVIIPLGTVHVAG